MTNLLVLALTLLGLVGFLALGGSLLLRDRSEGRDLIGPMAVVLGLGLIVWTSVGDPMPLAGLSFFGGLAAILGGFALSFYRIRRLRRDRDESRKELHASGVPEGAMELLRLEDRLDDVRIRAPHVGGFGLTLLVAGPFVGLAAVLGGPGPWIAAAITGSVPVAAGWGLWRRFREGRRIRAEIEARLESPPRGRDSPEGGSLPSGRPQASPGEDSSTETPPEEPPKRP